MTYCTSKLLDVLFLLFLFLFFLTDKLEGDHFLIIFILTQKFRNLRIPQLSTRQPNKQKPKKYVEIDLFFIFARKFENREEKKIQFSIILYIFRTLLDLLFSVHFQSYILSFKLQAGLSKRTHFETLPP